MDTQERDETPHLKLQGRLGARWFGDAKQVAAVVETFLKEVEAEHPGAVVRVRVDMVRGRRQDA